jgi:hypothetical protein
VQSQCAGKGVVHEKVQNPKLSESKSRREICGYITPPQPSSYTIVAPDPKDISHHNFLSHVFFWKLVFQRVSQKLHFIELSQCLAGPFTYAETLLTPTPESATVVTKSGVREFVASRSSEADVAYKKLRQ